MKNKPEVGDEIYVGSSYYMSHGEDDFEGGLATISSVRASDHLPEDNINYWMVSIDSRPGTGYNWRILMENQEELKKTYAGRVAHPNPDLRPEFNNPFDYVGQGKV